MTIIVSSAPGIDVSAFAAQFGKTIIGDPLKSAVQAYGFQTLYEMPGKLRFDTRHRLLSGHGLAVAANPDAVFDHSVFSYLADWMRWDWASTPTEMWENIVQAAKVVAQNYRSIHHAPPGKPRGYDGFHWLDHKNDRQIESLMRHLYAEFGVSDRVTTR